MGRARTEVILSTGERRGGSGVLFIPLKSPATGSKTYFHQRRKTQLRNKTESNLL